MDRFLSPVRISLLTALLLAGCQSDGSRTVSPRALAASQPVPVNEVQDAAIWVHPTDPAASLLLITNERRGLEVHNLDGTLLKHLNDGCRPCYVDVVYQFPINGKPVDLAVASCQGDGTTGVKVWRIDPAKSKLKEATADSIIKVLDGLTPYGLCTYHSRKTGKSYFFVTSHSGKIEQYEMLATPEGDITAKKVRGFERPSEVKGCVADEERGVVYFAEDKVGVWRYPAEPDAQPEGKCVVRVGENGLVPAVKGPALYCTARGGGYLLVVSQGSKGGHTCIKAYQREGDNAFVLTIDPSAEGFGKLDHSSGLAVTNQPTTAGFPQGVLVVNDQVNLSASEDFKLYSWKDIADAGGLRIDTQWSPRIPDDRPPR